MGRNPCPLMSWPCGFQGGVLCWLEHGGPGLKSGMSPKHPFMIGELVRCECPEGICKLPVGLPRSTAVEVVASQIDITRVQCNGKRFTLPTACVFPRELTPR